MLTKLGVVVEEEEEDLAVYQPMPPQPEGGEVQSAVPGGDSTSNVPSLYTKSDGLH